MQTKKVIVNIHCNKRSLNGGKISEIRWMPGYKIIKVVNSFSAQQYSLAPFYLNIIRHVISTGNTVFSGTDIAKCS